jgi:hypothetical protein
VLADEQAVGDGSEPYELAAFGEAQAPALALDASCAPHVLSSLEWSGAVYSVRDPVKGWSSEITPMPAYSGAMVVGPTGEPFAASHDGNYNTTLWTRSDTWTKVDQVPEQAGVYAQGLGIDASGTLHAALSTSTGKPAAATRAGSWTTVEGDAVAYEPVLSVSSTASAHLAYWRWMMSSPQDKTNGLFWWSPPRPPELVATGLLPSTESQLRQLGLATSAPDADNPAGKPHVVFGRSPDGENSEIGYATRTGPGQWTLVSIVQAPPPTSYDQCVATTPTAPGQTCSYDFTDYEPFGLAASENGEVRIFYDAARFTGTMTAMCSSGPASCHWGGGGLRQDKVYMAWVAGGSVQTTALFSTNLPSVATVAVDSAGAMHLAFFEGKTVAQSTTYSTRYVRIGSP